MSTDNFSQVGLNRLYHKIRRADLDVSDQQSSHAISHRPTSSERSIISLNPAAAMQQQCCSS